MKSSTLENSFVQPFLQYGEPSSLTTHIKLQEATENNLQAASMGVLRYLCQALCVPGQFEPSIQL